MSLSMEFLCSEIQFRKDTVTSGKRFNKKTYESVIINYPNPPPQDYAAQVYVIKNEYEAVLAGQGTTMKSMECLWVYEEKKA